MPTPFPGMDPYLEHPALWPDLQNSLIIALRDALVPRLRPRYYVAVEERIYTFEPGELVLAGRANGAVVAPPGLPEPAQSQVASGSSAGVVVALTMPDLIRETYLEVRAVGSDEAVTVVEILSPSNKRPGEGRTQYVRKRRVIASLRTHLVEIDLLRSGEPMPIQHWHGISDYRIVVSRADQRPQALLLPFTVRQSIPPFTLPLYPVDPEPTVDLNDLLHALYDRGGYDMRLNYRGDPEPPLAPADAAWATELLQSAGLR